MSNYPNIKDNLREDYDGTKTLYEESHSSSHNKTNESVNNIQNFLGILTDYANNIITSATTLYGKINDIIEALLGKQDTLVSGTNIKTINGDTILGTGDLSISSGIGGYQANIYGTTLTSSTVGTYKQFSYTPEETETILTTTVNNNEVLFGTYIYDGDINTTLIEAGVWNFHFHGYVSNAVNSTVLRFVPFVRHIDTTETELFSYTTKDINSLTQTEYDYTTSQPGYVVAETDRLGMKVYASTTALLNINVNIIIGDGNASFMNVPLAIRHGQLRDRNTASQHPASSIDYDNTTSGLSSINVQNAIDELSSEKEETTTWTAGITTNKDLSGGLETRNSGYSFDTTGGNLGIYLPITAESGDTVIVNKLYNNNYLTVYVDDGMGYSIITTLYNQGDALILQYNGLWTIIGDNRPYLVGSKTVDETSIANDKIMVYNSTSGKLEYQDKPTGGGGGGFRESIQINGDAESNMILFEGSVGPATTLSAGYLDFITTAPTGQNFIVSVAKSTDQGSSYGTAETVTLTAGTKYVKGTLSGTYAEGDWIKIWCSQIGTTTTGTGFKFTIVGS